MMDVFNSFSSQLDDLLQRTCFKLQLTQTQFKLAEVRYNGVANWLAGGNKLLTKTEPHIFPQGSLKIGTTVKPLKGNEYDLDLVCQLNVDATKTSPSQIMDAVEGRLKESDTYKELIKRKKKRCIRLDYANEFHLDIVPAVPDMSSQNGSLKIPDRELKIWMSSNPKGYAKWFEMKSLQYFSLVKARQIEPLPKEDDGEIKSPLKYVVQLAKRNRDLFFAGKEEKLIPKSIVISTLLAEAYHGTPSIEATMTVALNAIVMRLAQTNGRMFDVYNPMNTQECLTEIWNEVPEAFSEFKSWIISFQKEWNQLLQERGSKLMDHLEHLFGETAKKAFEEQAEIISNARKEGKIWLTPGVGSIVLHEVPRSIRVSPNTNFGN